MVALIIIFCIVLLGICFLSMFCVIPNQRENELIEEINRMTEAGYKHEIVTDAMGYITDVRYYK